MYNYEYLTYTMHVYSYTYTYVHVIMLVLGAACRGWLARCEYQRHKRQQQRRETAAAVVIQTGTYVCTVYVASESEGFSAVSGVNKE